MDTIHHGSDETPPYLVGRTHSLFCAGERRLRRSLRPTVRLPTTTGEKFPPEPGSADAERHAPLQPICLVAEFYKLPHFVKERSLPFWDLLIVMEADALESSPSKTSRTLKCRRGKGHVLKLE